jgi:hypothetical protein
LGLRNGLQRFYLAALETSLGTDFGFTKMLGFVLIEDEIEAVVPIDLVWNFHTRANVELDGGRAILSLDGKQIEVRILSSDGARFEVIPADLRRRRRSNPTYTISSSACPQPSRLVSPLP